MGNNISSTENDINIYIDTVWTAVDRLTSIRKSDLSDKIKPEFFQVVDVLLLLYGCTT